MDKHLINWFGLRQCNVSPLNSCHELLMQRDQALFTDTVTIATAIPRPSPH